MSAKRKVKLNEVIKIDPMDLLRKSKDKLGSHDPKVTRGTGVIDSDKVYKRKDKYPKRYIY